MVFNGEIVDPPALPPYPELILAAIEAVDAINGANKTAISKHIEDAYGPMPAVHSTLLSHHLNRMKKTGELVMLKNNYMKFDPNAPRRGRGRPPKAKSRGRPSKTVKPVKTVLSSTTTAPEADVSSPRPRGRPPKNVNPVETVPSSATVPESEVSSPRLRGRPTKTVAPVTSPSKESPGVSGRKRGRPSKATKTTVEASKVAPPPSGSSRGRGRPPKVKPAATAPGGA